MNKPTVTYSSTGVDYSVMDPLKKLAQAAGKQTSGNLLNFSIKEVEESRGESAFVWEEEDSYRAFVIEGLGTKNLVADEMEKITGKTYYYKIAQDTVAAIVNDIITVGAIPQVINAYFAAGGPKWFSNKERSAALVAGFAEACNLAGAAWGGGETPGLSGIINRDTIDLAGAAVGIIKPKQRLILGDKIQAGDAILLTESSGIHANGLSLARAVAGKLPEGYATKLLDGTMYGENLLIPTHVYVSLVKDLFEAGIDIHYLINITGHGWRKLMRANRSFTYQISQIPPIPPIFEFIQRLSHNSDEEMYGNFNMGAGFAIFVPSNQAEKTQEIINKAGFKSWNAGVVQDGPKKVVIEPKNTSPEQSRRITFKAESLGVR